MSRYVVSVVYPDGNPMVVDRHDTLEAALRSRDARRSPRRRLSEHWMVHDTEDEERGYLDWHHLEDAA